MAKKQNNIRNLRTLRTEIEKARVAVDYTQEDLQESFEMTREKVAPSQLTGFVDQVIPIIGQVFPIGKLLWHVLPQFGSGEQKEGGEEADTQHDGQEEKQSFFSRVKQGTIKVLLPFAAGTLAAGGLWLSKKIRKANASKTNSRQQEPNV